MKRDEKRELLADMGRNELWKIFIEFIKCTILLENCAGNFHVMKYEWGMFRKEELIHGILLLQSNSHTNRPGKY